jgi:hypothetical protein
MSDDPETVRQIGELVRRDGPLLVLDVDDVVLDFIGAFRNYLQSEGYELNLATFRLHGNIRRISDGAPVSDPDVSALIDAFFACQAEWQTPMEGVADALAAIGERASIAFLTSMPHRHRQTRRAHLDGLQLPYPLLTTETPKGPAIAMLRAASKKPVAFVDDIPRNLLSVRDAVPDAHLFHLMASDHMRSLLPPLPAGITAVANWDEALPRIVAALGI